MQRTDIPVKSTIVKGDSPLYLSQNLSDSHTQGSPMNRTSAFDVHSRSICSTRFSFLKKKKKKKKKKKEKTKQNNKSHHITSHHIRIKQRSHPLVSD